MFHLQDINSDSIEPDEKNKRCAPHLKFEKGSCAKLDILHAFAKAHNDTCTDKIPIHEKYLTQKQDLYKKHLVKELSKRYTKNQNNWDKQASNAIKAMKQVYRDEFLYNTFRPDGPEKKNEWLNTMHILNAMRQYEQKYTDFKFLGAVPMDFNEYERFGIKSLDFKKDLIDINKTKIGVVLNLDNHDESGSHWVALYSDLLKNKVYYFDSYGMKPEKRVVKFMDRIGDFCSKHNKTTEITKDYNKERHQREGSEGGIYSMNFILRSLRGDKFEDICQSRIHDSKIEKCRLKYFNNVNKEIFNK
jgi:hypothetical protein